MSGRRLTNLIAQHKTAAITMIIGLIAGPIVAVMLNDYISVTPKRLAGLLEDDKVSVLERGLNITKDSKANAKVTEFNELRKQYRQPITLENLDLSNKSLNGVNLESVIILNSNLSSANLENSNLENSRISGDMSDINLRNASLSNVDLASAHLSNADLSRADLPNANLPNANLPNANLENANLT
jgi:uncharacterized protein YjbI with pentapeptide repeats